MNAVKEKAFSVSLGSYCSWKKGELVIVSESEWNLISLVIDMTANLTQGLQTFPCSVYSSLVFVDFIKHD